MEMVVVKEGRVGCVVFVWANECPFAQWKRNGNYGDGWLPRLLCGLLRKQLVAKEDIVLNEPKRCFPRC